MITTALEFGFQADHLDSNGITNRQKCFNFDCIANSLFIKLLAIFFLLFR